VSLIALHGVRKAYTVGDTQVEVLHGIDLAIAEGEFVALMGPSESGKTTCLEILAAISRPSAGTYRFDGEPVHDLDDDRLADLRAQRMGFVFQTFNLMPRMSALRNAALPLLYAGRPRAEREQRARLLLDKLGLGHRLAQPRSSSCSRRAPAFTASSIRDSRRRAIGTPSSLVSTRLPRPVGRGRGAASI
jgi:putative ABC transport system ATP-binding protein